MKIARKYISTITKSIMVVILASVVFASCKKDSDSTPPPVQPSPAEGFWVGKYTTIGFLGFSNYAMLIKPGGVARIYDMDAKTDTLSIPAGAKVNGTWTLNGMTLQTTYKAGTKTVTTSALLNAAYNNMEGTWSFDGVVKGDMVLDK